MAEITFTRDQTAQLVKKIQDYFQAELDAEIGDFDAEFLIDFIGNEFGAVYYNKGLHDAKAAMVQRIDTISESIDELEKPENF